LGFLTLRHAEQTIPGASYLSQMGPHNHLKDSRHTALRFCEATRDGGELRFGALDLCLAFCEHVLQACNEGFNESNKWPADAAQAAVGNLRSSVWQSLAGFPAFSPCWFLFSFPSAMLASGAASSLFASASWGMATTEWRPLKVSNFKMFVPKNSLKAPDTRVRRSLVASM